MDTLRTPEMLRPPINRALKQLDRSLFHKSIPLSVAKVSDFKHISKLRHDLGQDIFQVERKQHVINLPGADGQPGKGFLLRPEIKADDGLTWSPMVSELVKAGQIEVLPHTLNLDYDYWDYYEIMCSILPDEAGEDIPSSYSLVGHVAHVNLRERYLPYKYLIGQVIIDKQSQIHTVINKVENVGSSDIFRTFEYEVLAGKDDLDVTVNEQNCTFCFDYSKVYWNSRLNTEHERLVALFKPGEAICDVMAGVGPFAAPAGKKQCWVLANDLNPHCFASLKDNIRRNKIENYVQPSNEDGHEFIRSATHRLLHERAHIDVTPKVPRALRNDPRFRNRSRKIIHRPLIFSHYVLNLPATALTFLPSFVGIYTGFEQLFEPHILQKMPLVHVYCFSKQVDDDEAKKEIADEIGKQLGVDMLPAENAEEGEGNVSVWDVRLVAPKKRYFCATFRLPREVAFRKV